MADAKLTALTAASALAAADLFYVSQSAASRKATGTQLLALVGTTYVPLAGGTMTGALTIASGTLTASAPALNITQTWNEINTKFFGLTINVTDINSLSSSLLADFQIAGVSKLYIRKDGAILTAASGFFGGLNLASGGEGVWSSASLRLKSSSAMGFNSTTDTTTGAIDAVFYRDAAGVLAQRNGTNAQTLRVYGTYTDSSNYERLSLSTTAGSSVNISAETLGTGGDNLDIVLTPAGTGRVAVGNFLLYPTGVMAMFTNAAAVLWGASGDAGIHRGAAGQLDVTNGTAGTWRDLKLRNLLQTAYQEVTEMTAPSAPAGDSVRIYAEDNGSGKTRLMALFATGAAQQISIEP